VPAVSVADPATSASVPAVDVGSATLFTAAFPQPEILNVNDNPKIIAVVLRYTVFFLIFMIVSSIIGLIRYYKFLLPSFSFSHNKTTEKNLGSPES
jgi:hypothetical protein